MFRTLLFGILMFILGFAYGRDETLWRKTIDFIKRVIKKTKEFIGKKFY